MNRYLNEQQLRTNLSLGKIVEQWLGYTEQETYTILKWLIIYKEKNTDYTVNYFESFDKGSPSFFDIYEFSAIDPDNPYNSNSFHSIDDALKFTVDQYNASYDKFVSNGMIQEEYLDYLNKS